MFENSVWSLNIESLKWNLECLLPEPRRDFAVIAIDDNYPKCKTNHGCEKLGIGFFVIGGEGIHGNALKTVWFYDIYQKIWIQKASLNYARFGMSAALVNNEIWIAGGMIDEKIPDADSMKTVDIISNTMEYYSLKCKNQDGDDKQEGCGSCNPCGNTQWKISKLLLRIPRLFGRFCLMAPNELYLIGGIGVNEANNLTSLDSIDKFSFEFENWLQCGYLQHARWVLVIFFKK